MVRGGSSQGAASNSTNTSASCSARAGSACAQKRAWRVEALFRVMVALAHQPKPFVFSPVGSSKVARPNMFSLHTSISKSQLSAGPHLQLVECSLAWMLLRDGAWPELACTSDVGTAGSQGMPGGNHFDGVAYMQAHQIPGQPAHQCCHSVTPH